MDVNRDNFILSFQMMWSEKFSEMVWTLPLEVKVVHF